MSRLLDRNKQIPNGMSFFVPETKWSPPRFASFDTIVHGLISHVAGNPALSGKYPTDYNGAAELVDAWNAGICEQMGWNQYIQGGGGAPAIPFPAPTARALNPLDPRQLSAVADKVKKIFQGVKTLNSWIDSGEPAVSPALSQQRASICVECPLNGQGGLEAWFTRPAAQVIQKQFERLSDRKLSTTLDEKLGICEACLCPMKLKVHTPIQLIKDHFTPEQNQALRKGNNCWILRELL